MATGIRKIIKSKQMPNGVTYLDTNKILPIEVVDKLADELVYEYSNNTYRSWYCGIIYEFGASQVNEWRRRATEGHTPAKLFSKYVKDARTFRGSRKASHA